MTKATIIKIDDVEYVRKDSVSTAAVSVEGLPYVIIRSERAGVFAGFLVSRDGQEVVLRQARRIWYWQGAASVSQLAIDGTSKPDQCKFPEAVSEMTVLTVIEVIPTTEKARESIVSVKVWRE